LGSYVFVFDTEIIIFYIERGKNMPVFTESKKGYDKEEVNSFIKQLNEATEAQLAEKDAKIKELENEIKILSKKSDSQPENTVSDTDAQTDLEEIKKKYERLCADMGEKLLLAEVKASEIIDEANSKAEKIVADARINANKEVEEILEDAKLSSAGIKKAVAEYSAKEREIMALLHTTEETFNLALERISGHIYKGKE
jgi:cell division septum initiation protein DivIVA